MSYDAYLAGLGRDELIAIIQKNKEKHKLLIDDLDLLSKDQEKLLENATIAYPRGKVFCEGMIYAFRKSAEKASEILTRE